MKWKEMQHKMNGLQIGKKIMVDYLIYGSYEKLAKLYSTNITNINSHIAYWGTLLNKAYPKLFAKYKEATGYSIRKMEREVEGYINISIFRGLPKQISYKEFIDHMINSNAESSVNNLMSLAEKEGIKIIG